MPDNTRTRQFIEQRLGGRWTSLCIDFERDESGNPYTIYPQYVGRDDTANYLQSQTLPLEQATALQKAIAAIEPKYMPSAVPTNAGEGVVRLSMEKARLLEQHEGFHRATEDAPLLDAVRAQDSAAARIRSGDGAAPGR